MRLAGHYRREVLPLRQIAFDQAQLQFNSMLIDVFALVTESRQLHQRHCQRHRSQA